MHAYEEAQDFEQPSSRHPSVRMSVCGKSPGGVSLWFAPLSLQYPGGPSYHMTLAGGVTLFNCHCCFLLFPSAILTCVSDARGGRSQQLTVMGVDVVV